MTRPRLSPVFVAALATALVRCAVALSRIDELELELYSGSLAWALLEGLPLHPDQLPVIEHNRGSVVVGLLLLPFYAWTGPALWPLKVIAIGTGVLVAMLTAHLVTRAAGRGAGYAAGLLVALLPPAFQMVDILALGSHADSILFLVGSIAVLAGVGARGLRRPLPALAVGTLCGLGYFYSLQFVVVIPALLAAGLCMERAERAAGQGAPTRPALALGLPLALLPIALAHLASKFITTSTEIVNKSLSDRVLPEGVGGALSKFAHTWTDELWRSWLFLQNGGALCAGLYGASLALGLLLLLPRLWKLEPLAVFFFLCPLGVTAAYALTDFKLNHVSTLDGGGSRYMLPAMLTMAAWVALGHGWLAQRGRGALAWAVSGPALVAGALGCFQLLDPGYAWRQPPMRGTEFPKFRGHIAHAGGEDYAARLEWIERLDPDWAALRPLCYEVTMAPATSFESDGMLLRALGQLDPAQGALARYQAVALGHYAAQHWMRAQGSVSSLLRRARDATPYELQEWMLRGVGKRWLLSLAQEHKIQTDAAAGVLPPGYRRRVPVFSLNALRSLPTDLAQPVAEGLGFQFGWRTTPYEHMTQGLLPQLMLLPPLLKRHVFSAAGKGYRVRYVEASYTPPEPFDLRVEQILDQPAHEAFRRGLTAPADTF